MATLQEYYLKDFDRLVSTDTEWLVEGFNSEKIAIIAKIHFDFDASVYFISFYIPDIDIERQTEIFGLLLSKHKDLLQMKKSVYISTKKPGENETSSENLSFSGKVFFYYEGEVDVTKFSEIQSQAKVDGLNIHYRDNNYSKERSKFEKPLAFISHDSRDKVVASQIASELQKRACPIWYDEYSLKLGDSLRESIEKGLKECKVCVLVLSPNFLQNSGWTKTEFDTIFTREIIEKEKLLIPVWADVTREDIYNYSPILVDRFGINWNKGLDEVVSAIHRVILTRE